MKTIGIVKTTCGLVQGVEMTGKYEGITQFRGIPFALAQRPFPSNMIATCFGTFI